MIKFTPREKDVIKLLLEGKTNKEIGDTLFISFHTVKAVLENIYRKSDCYNRVTLSIKLVKEILNNPDYNIPLPKIFYE